MYETTNKAFTMAEILLSLTIIGVVAAITLPSLTGNINERTWNTQRKALYARMSQAISLMPALNGYGTLDDTTDNATETFINSGLAKVLKINNICDSEHLEDCGIPTQMTNLKGSIIDSWPKTLVELNPMFNGSFIGSGWNADGTDRYYEYYGPDVKAAAFETANGESIAVYYNPYCKNILLTGLGVFYMQPRMCANFIYDLNGKKGPNTFGKDIGFITALNPSDSIVVAPMPVNITSTSFVNYKEAIATCNNGNSENRLPNIDEANAMFYNKRLLGIESDGYWTATRVPIAEKRYYAQTFHAGTLDTWVPSTIAAVHCVKR